MSEYIISTEQIKGITPYLLTEKKIPSWLACWALWDVSGAVPQRRDDGVAIGLPEIVRCRDCVWLKPRDEENGGRNWCKNMSFETEPDGFCSRGERRSE